MISSLVLLTIFCPFVAALSFDETAGTVQLTISQGALLGKRIDSYDNRTGYGFLGIPFGAPTGGAARYRKPVPADNWEGIRDVTVKGEACAAVGELTYKVPQGGPMSEDCLHTYIYTSKRCLEQGGCPIMWVMHGGRYNFESPVVFNDSVIVHNFVSQDVVVVIPAYRLHNFGFLNLAPGMNLSASTNVAVWDLFLAMQWTHREIHHFGGDPKRITLFGHSAGSQFADILSVSPKFNGLYNGMVLMSGADTAYEAGTNIALVQNETILSGREASWVMATLLHCADYTTNRTDLIEIEEVIECLRSKSWQEIVAAIRLLNSHPEDFHGPHADGPDGILPVAPSVLALSRPLIPVMIGTVAAEFHDTKYAIDEDGTANLYKVSELCEGFGYTTGYAHPEVMTKRCIDQYMQGKNAINLEQDTQFFLPTYQTARSLARKGNKVYLYSFTYTGIGNAFKKYMKLGKDDHPGHSEDFVYILGMHRGNFTARDYELERIYSGMVLNFVKTGYPDPGAGQPAWKPFSRLGRDYYEIDFDTSNKMPGMKRGYQSAAIKLWSDDAQKYGGPITAPSDFPPHCDRFYPMDMVTAFASHHTNASLAHDKTLAAEEEAYKVWTEYINNRRFKHLQGLKNFRSITVDQPILNTVSQPAFTDNLMEILIICVSAILIFILLRCCLHCVGVYQERKGYEEF